jgi:hypothetical protein
MRLYRCPGAETCGMMTYAMAADAMEIDRATLKLKIKNNPELRQNKCHGPVLSPDEIKYMAKNWKVGCGRPEVAVTPKVPKLPSAKGCASLMTEQKAMDILHVGPTILHGWISREYCIGWAMPCRQWKYDAESVARCATRVILRTHTGRVQSAHSGIKSLTDLARKVFQAPTMEWWDIKNLCEKHLDGLPERERDIISRRFGIGGPRMTLEAVGEIYGISRERIRQVENEALEAINSLEAINGAAKV